MRRSEINAEISQAVTLFDQIGFRLPPFAYWGLEQWKDRGIEIEEIVENQLGWDVTDYGCGNFNEMGLLLFTIRNGNSRLQKKYGKTYAEKLMVVKEGQTAPLHFHWKKKEDIINRGGGDLVIQIFGSTDNGRKSERPTSVSIDGIRQKVNPGGEIILTPGESIYLEPLVYHLFYARKNTGSVIIGEVSEVNDDENDNRFYDSIGRFPDIVEDEPPLHLLCTEYKRWIPYFKDRYSN